MSGLFGHQRLQFLLATLLQARARLAERLATPAGMTHQLRQTVRQLMDQPYQLRGTEPAGDLETREGVGGATAMPLEHAMEAAPHELQCAAGGALHQRRT